MIAETDETATSERVVIDLHPQRRARCFDGFWDRLGVAGSMPIVATSFTDVLRRLLNAKVAPSWSKAGVGVGDTYA